MAIRVVAQVGLAPVKDRLARKHCSPG
jgi:hypothetical protein